MRLPVTAVVILVAASGCLGAESEPGTPSPSPSAPVPALDCPHAGRYEGSQVNVTLETSRGSVGVVLYGSQSPLSVCNFLRYATEDFYDGTIFHRVCSHVIQAGGFNPYTQTQKPTHPPIANEAKTNGLHNYRGTLGMARSSAPDSATSHFYVNLKDNLYLDPGGSAGPDGYAVFGNVTSGWDVVQAIASTTTLPETGPGCSGVPAPTMETTIRDVRVVGA